MRGASRIRRTGASDVPRYNGKSSIRQTDFDCVGCDSMTPKGNIGTFRDTHCWSLAIKIMEFRRRLVALARNDSDFAKKCVIEDE